MRIAVIGGKGHFGSAVVSALQHPQQKPAEIVIASRTSQELPLDLCNPDTFSALRSFDLIINCADSVGAPSDQVMRYCLREGLTFMDIGADDIRSAHQLTMSVPQPRGRVLLGAGLFPGLSTAMCIDLLNDKPLKRLDLGVRLSPLSGAGEANVDLMTALLSRRQPGGFHTLPFLRINPQTAVGLTLPDAPLLSHQNPETATHTWMAFQPGFFRFSFASLAWLVPRLGPLMPLALWILRWQLWWVRAVLFRNTGSVIQLTAIANGDGATHQVHVADGREGVGLAAAAMARLWLQNPTLCEPGVHLAGSLFSLADLLSEMQAHSNEERVSHSLSQPGNKSHS